MKAICNLESCEDFLELQYEYWSNTDKTERFLQVAVENRSLLSCHPASRATIHQMSTD